MAAETNLTLADMLEQLPEDVCTHAPADPSLAAILAKAGRNAPPVGRFSRFWTLGTLQGKIAAAYAFWWVRGMWTSVDQREHQLNETHLKAAIQLLGTMSTLRGAVMKLGQLMAHWPGVAPEEFADVLGRLHFQAPPMHFSLLREQVRAELGAEIEDLFDDFEPVAVAAASLGQVHRARLKGTGQLVAVKIQYPGIARTIRDDVANLRALLVPIRFSADAGNVLEQLEDIEKMLTLETDYRAEAENLKLARATLAGMDDVLVPAVHERLSTGRILTMDWIEGDHLPAYLAKKPTQAQRDRAGALMLRAWMRLCYRAHMLQSDVHPGNFTFLADGRVGILDLGCVRRYNADELAYLNDAERADGISREAVRDVIIRGAALLPAQQKDEARVKLLTDMYDWEMEPTRGDTPFHFSEAYMARGIELFRQIIRRRYVRTMPVNTWITKSFIGIRAMLTRLDAHVPLGKILREESTVHRATPMDAA